MNDNQELDEAYEQARNHRVAAALDGLLVAGLCEINDEIVGLLLSEQEIGREVREKLAAAFSAGRPGYRPQVDSDQASMRPQIFIRGGGTRRKICDAIMIRRNWMEAYETLLAERKKGRRGTRLVAEVAGKYGISDSHMNKDVRLFYQEFLKVYNDPESEIVKFAELSASYGSEEMRDENFEHIVRSYFIERMAEEEVGETLASYDLGFFTPESPTPTV